MAIFFEIHSIKLYDFFSCNAAPLALGGFNMPLLCGLHDIMPVASSECVRYTLMVCDHSGVKQINFSQFLS